MTRYALNGRSNPILNRNAPVISCLKSVILENCEAEKNMRWTSP